MADNKATQALKDANYKVKLILGASPNKESRLVDITKPVVETLADRDLFPGDDDYGIAYDVVGIYEMSDRPNYLATTPLRTHRYDTFLLQDIERVLEASIVNAKQLEAAKELVRAIFKKHEKAAMDGIDSALRYELFKIDRNMIQ